MYRSFLSFFLSGLNIFILGIDSSLSPKLAFHSTATPINPQPSQAFASTAVRIHRLTDPWTKLPSHSHINTHLTCNYPQPLNCHFYQYITLLMNPTHIKLIPSRQNYQSVQFGSIRRGSTHQHRERTRGGIINECPFLTDHNFTATNTSSLFAWATSSDHNSVHPPRQRE